MKPVAAIFTFIYVGAVFLFTVAVWGLWLLHPWTPPGKALEIGRWKFKDHEFQVWQRKNQSMFEPFADGLFVRHGTNEWSVFCFDIQDGYRPTVKLIQQQKRISIYRNGEPRGIYDMGSNVFFRNGQIYGPDHTDMQTPPGDWWLK